VRLRLYHHPDGTRVAYREEGTGPPIALLHSAMLSHKEFEPVVEHLSDRYRVVLPDLPLHGDSEDRPRHPYTPDWFVDVMAGFCNEVCGPRPLVGGHGIGADILLRATIARALAPGKLVVMPTNLHRPSERRRARAAWRIVAQGGVVPGLDRLLAHGARVMFRPEHGRRLTSRGVPEARDLVRHAFADVGGNGNLARSWAAFARHWPNEPWRDLLDRYGDIDVPVLLLWADDDQLHPLLGAEEALDLLPNGQLRVLPGTGYLIAYDDPVGVARELAAFCG
jgi:pimeloyl-ACP methyl ester carboxylesterase